MPIIKEKSELVVAIWISVVSIIILLIAIIFEAIGKIIMMVGCLTVSYELLRKLGILDYIDRKYSNNKPPKKVKQKKIEHKKPKKRWFRKKSKNQNLTTEKTGFIENPISRDPVFSPFNEDKNEH